MQPIKQRKPLQDSDLKNLESLLRSLLADSSLVNGLSLIERQALESSFQIVQSLSKLTESARQQEKS